jgi:hypothetical protein
MKDCDQDVSQTNTSPSSAWKLSEKSPAIALADD